MTIKEIRERAKQKGIKPGKMKKIELIRTIQTEEGNYPCYNTATSFCDQTACCWREDCLTT